MPDWAHSVHVTVDGLEPDRWYWYRFRVDGIASAAGRTRTAPAPAAMPDRLRFAIASCQQYEQGWYTAYRHLRADDPDLVVHLGDYIYESSWGRNHVRKHNAPEPTKLSDYRVRHALYKTDPDLQAMHRSCPWIFTWDDHEVDNDYADSVSEEDDPPAEFMLRRAAAYRAWYEHMPLPSRAVPSGPYLQLYGRVGWGRLADFCVLDIRQYRSQQVCPRPGRAGGNVVAPEACEARMAPGRTMLGAAQEAWLDRAWATTPARWNFVAQQTVMAQMDSKPGPGQTFFTDGWDGYPLARAQLLQGLVDRRVANPVVLGGDVHFHCVTDLKRDFDDERSPVVATEFVGTSITSQSRSQAETEKRLPDNPHVRYARSDYRGYTRFDLRPGRLAATLRGVESVRVPDAPALTLASFVVEDGLPGAKPA